MLSIIIPAHNEESVIRRCLAAITRDGCSDLQIIVVCNGCTDDTGQTAKSFGESVTVISTPIASKTTALNLGDQVATGFPRFYVDADVVICGEAIHRVAEVLNGGPFLAAAPVPQMDMARVSLFVRAYYDIWTRLPYFLEGMMGVGVYALSEEGHRRLGEFPDVIADDGYVRLMFAPHERTTVTTARSVVTAPRTLSNLIRIKTRSRLGLYELKRRYPDLIRQDSKDYVSAMHQFLYQPRSWPRVGVYLLVNLLSRIRASWQMRSLHRYRWERDHSARTGGRQEPHQGVMG